MLRAQAELDNYRKRARRELEDERRYATHAAVARSAAGARQHPAGDRRRGKVAGRRAACSTASRWSPKAWKRPLARHHCKRIDALRKPFDPAVAPGHLAAADATSIRRDTVMLVAQDGYMLHDRVVRPAQVIVSTDRRPRD